MEQIVFPNKIRVLRRMRGYTMQGLSDFMGLSLSLLSKMEKGFRRVSEEQMSSIARFLDCEQSDLLLSEEDSETPLMKVWQDAIEKRLDHNKHGGLKVMGAGLRFIRMQQNITMSDFAKQTGITVSVYHRIESGEREIYKTEFVAIAKTLKLEPEELTKEIYNLYKGGVLDKYSENLRAGRGKAHVSADAKSIMNLSKTFYGKEIYEFSKNKMVALLGEGREDGKLHVDKTAEALVFAPFSLRRRKKVYAVKSHPKSTKNILPEHAIYFIRYDSKVSEGDLAVVYEKDFDQHEKHDAEIVSVEKRGEDLWAVSHASGNEFKIKSLQKNQIHRVVFIALDDEDQA